MIDADHPELAHWVARLCHPPCEALRPLLYSALTRCVQLGPQADSEQNLPDWLTRAVNLISEELPHFTPPDAPGAAWPFLFIAHRLMHAQERAYHHAIHHATHYPPCPVGVEPRPTHRPHHRREHTAVTLPGLGLLLAGYWMPADSQRMIQQARHAGIDWCQADAFDAVLAPVHSAPASPPPLSPPRTAPLTPSPVPTPPPSAPHDPTDTATALRHALIDAIVHLSHHPPCNRNGSSVWVTGDTVWVVARILAQQMIAHPALHPHPHLKHRTVLYRALVSHGLAIPDTQRPIWTITLSFGLHHQQADVLNIPRTFIWPEASASPAPLPDESIALNRRVKVPRPKPAMEQGTER